MERHDAVLIEQRSEDGNKIEKLWVATAKDTFKLMQWTKVWMIILLILKSKNIYIFLIKYNAKLIYDRVNKRSSQK